MLGNGSDIRHAQISLVKVKEAHSRSHR